MNGQAGSVNALLKLDASNFNSGIKNSASKLTDFVKTMEGLGNSSSKFRDGIKDVINIINEFKTSLSSLDKISEFKSLDRLGNALKKIVDTAIRFNKEGTVTTETFAQLGNGIRAFMNALGGVEIKLTNVINSERMLVNENNQLKQSTYNVDAEFKKLQQSIMGMKPESITNVNREFREMRDSLMNIDVSGFNKIKSGIDGVVESAYRLTAIRDILGNSFYGALNQSANAMSYLGNTAQNTGVNFANLGTNISSAGNNVTTSMNGLNTSLNTTTNSMRNANTIGTGISVTMGNMTSKTNSASQSTKNFSQSTTTASSNVNRLKSNVGGLTQSLSALRGMVSMVASMFLYNFAHNMMISVQNTIKAKSEMHSFLNTMGMTGNQIDSFNAALDRTAERFQRINKYNIGETVANIGLEFDLSAQEMEKAMSVTSMVTSEYLRAGRNADEAALAVKDIMQGQFQRLSRETGVKGEQLKEAGWSGDVNDVMGLMDALEKVGKARHWDVFAEKASSLNDILLITQNRFSEWAADISEGITPIVTESFNALIMMIDNITAVLSSLGEALHLPDWVGTVAMISGAVLAFGALFTSTIRARTGLGLLDIAHKGLGQSIVATLFNIKAEEMEYQNATTIAMGRILGLNNEIVARDGLGAAIKASIGMQQAENIAKQEGMLVSEENIAKTQLETWAKQQNIGETERKILTDRLEAAQSLSTGEAIMTKVFALDAEIVKNHGILAALGATRSARVADAIATEGETVAEETLTVARAAGIAVMSAYLAVLLAISAAAAVFLVPMIQQTMEATETMKQFNEFVRDGDNVLKDAASTVDHYKNKVAELEKAEASAKRGSQEHLRISRELKDAREDLSTAEGNLYHQTQALQQARSALGKHEETMNQLSIDRHQMLVEKLREVGYSYEDAEEKARSYYDVVGKGVKALQDTANYVAYANQRLEAQASLLHSQGFTGEEYAKRLEAKAGIQEELATQYERMQKAESITEKADAWLQFEWFHGVNWVDDFKNAWDSQDWDSIWPHIEETIKMALPGLGTLDGLFGKPLEDFFNADHDKMFMDWANQLGSGLMNALNNIGGNMHEVATGLWNKLTEAFSGLFSGEGGGGGLLPQKIDTSWLLNSIFGLVDSTGIGEWFNNNVILPIQEYISTIDIASLMMASPVDMFGALLNMIFGEGTYEKINAYIQTTIIDPLMNLPTAIQGYLTMAVGNFVGFANQLLQQGISAGSNFLNGVVSFISQLPSRVYSYITQTASNIISGASAWVSNARSKASETVNAVINQVSQLPDKVYNEFVKIGQRIRDAISAAVQAATQFGSDIVNAVLGALHIASPGIIQEKIATEFANIGGRIAENTANAESEATNFGQAIVNGMDSQMTNVMASADALSNAMNQTQADVVLDQSFVGDYQSDAMVISGINQTMTTDTTMAFDTMGSTVNGTINGISTNLQTSYMTMNTNQMTALTTMQNQNRTAFTNLQTQTSTSLNNMRNTTQNVTVQMVNAWNHMKDNIIASADQLKTQSTAHFNNLSSNIGSFYQKLQNPSMWGGGDNVPTRYYNHARGQRGIRAVKQAFGVTPQKRYAGGPTPDNIPQRMSLRKLRSIVGSPSLFRGMDLNQEVDVADFLSMFDGGFGWGDWHSSHFNHIKNTSGEWDMRGPSIMHRIDTGMAFKVKEFYNSQPSISFGSFQSMAEALFSAIPYEFYYNSDAHGNWVNALYAGSCNCYDGANAIIALASTCGFSGHMESGTWNGIPHVYAVINGKKMDTTGWQNRRDWNGVSAGGPPHMKNTGGDKIVNITVDMSNSTFNGEDDFENRMRDVAQRVMREEVNTSITVGI